MNDNCCSRRSLACDGVLLFLYNDVLEFDPGWLDDVVRAKRPQRLPTVLSEPEVQAILHALHGVSWLMAMVLYGAGLRLRECLRVRGGWVGTLVAIVADSSCCAPFATNVPPAPDDAVPEIEPYDDLCGCPRPTRPSYDGRLVVEMGDSSMRVQYRRTADGVELHFGNSVGSASLNPTQRVRASIPTVFIPESLKFLGAIEGEQVDAIISPYHEAPMAQAVSLRSFVDEEAEEFVVRTQRTRQSFDVEGEDQAS